MLPAMIQSYDDNALLCALQQGSKQAFAEIYRRYSRPLFLQAYRKVGVHDVCEDILQEVFSALWLRRDTLQPGKSLKAYLEGILRHKVVDYYRLSCLRLKHLDALTHMLDQPDTPLTEALHAKEQESALHYHIQSLSERVRTIFLLSRYDGLSVEDISEKLQLSNQTVRNQISKALKSLRLKWEGSAE
jgi:RNA polymerase sigma-70 factor (family 1)